MEVLDLASEHAGEGVLAHEERLVAESPGERLEGRHDVVFELGDQFGVEHDGFGRAAQRLERAPLQRCQGVERSDVGHRRRLYRRHAIATASVTVFRVGR